LYSESGSFKIYFICSFRSLFFINIFSGFGSGALLIPGIFLEFLLFDSQKIEFNILSKKDSFLILGAIKLIDQPLGTVLE